jgi:predicted enzyme related to lactoylglutathione lyase
MGKPVVHWEITAKDAERLESFYNEMFEWSVTGESPIHYRQVDTGTQEGIQGSIAETDGSWPSGALFYVQVDDVKEYLARAEQLGGATLLPPTQINGDSTIAIFRDPEGVAVGLVQG